MKESEVSDHQVVIVGGGIAGLATALALHRKGIKSVVLERAENLRSAEGSAIGIRQNGWKALDQLGVADSLRQTAFPIQRERDIWLDKDKQQGKPMIGESRCLKRKDLITALASALPPDTIQFGHQIISISENPQTTYPVLQLLDGRSIVTKVLIGCDGGNSVVADYLGLKPPKIFGYCGIRGFTNYPNGHSFGYEFARIRKNKTLVGRIPIDDKLVYWFVAVQRTSAESKITHRDPELIQGLTLESVKDYPNEIIEMMKNSDMDSLSFSHLRYRAPWDLLMAKFRKGTITVAGDAMHVMGPFLGQGGSAGLEDSVVLARNLAHKLSSSNVSEIGEAIDDYIGERRMRVVKLSTQTYLTGYLLVSSSFWTKVLCILLMIILFYDRNGHAKYDCGLL